MKREMEVAAREEEVRRRELWVLEEVRWVRVLDGRSDEREIALIILADSQAYEQSNSVREPATASCSYKEADEVVSAAFSRAVESLVDKDASPTEQTAPTPS
jgi:hypothetical protein